MNTGFTLFRPFFSSYFKMTWFLTGLLIFKSFSSAFGQVGCSPISTLPCNNVQVSLPVSLNFDGSVASTIVDKNGAGTGFTMVDAYSGTRLAVDGAPSNSNVPGYEASKLTLSGGRLQIVTNKGINHQANNNLINALGVKVDSRGKLQIETTLLNPFNGTSSQQGGLWFGLNDKTYLKLVVIANSIELRREINDVTSTVAGTSNPDQRITGTITNLNTMTVRLRLIVDPATNTAEGFYSTNGGSTYLNVGAGYSTKTLNISGMGLTTSTAYAGIFASHRNATTPVTYTFEDFSILAPSATNQAPVFSPTTYNFSVADNVALQTVVGSVSATDANGGTLTYSIVSGNTNGAFAINASTGAIRVAKFLDHHRQGSYALTVRVTDAGGLSDQASVAINVSLGTTVPAFTTISWSTVASQPMATHEVHGEVVNGKLYIFGGYDIQKQPTYTPTKRAYVYNPDNNSWSAIADLPHSPMGTNFGGITHEGLTTDGTDIYFAGGYTSNATGTGQIFGTKQVWKYNVATNSYTALPNLPQELAAGQLQYLKGKLHYMGGANLSRADVAVHYALDLDNLSAGWQALAPLSDARNHPGSAVFEGKIYFIGGAHNQDAATVTQKIVEVYDPNTNTWTRMADMPIGLDHISSAVTVIGNRILVLGGETSHNVKSNRVLAYSSSTNSWSDLTPLPTSKSAGVAVTLKGAIHYTGGNFATTNYKGIPGGVTTQQVASFTLINADTDQPIQTLTDGSTLNLATLPSRNLNVRANTNPSTVGSVVFNLSGTQSKTVTESRLPYALFGDNTTGDYYAWTPAVGTYTLKATPFTASGGTGTAGTSLTVGFTVIDQAAVTAIPQTQTISQVVAYPNPSTGAGVHIEVLNIGQQKHVKLCLMDMTGHILEVKNLTSDETGKASTILSTSKRLRAGLYLLQVQIPAGQIQRRLMIVN